MLGLPYLKNEKQENKYYQHHVHGNHNTTGHRKLVIA